MMWVSMVGTVGRRHKNLELAEVVPINALLKHWASLAGAVRGYSKQPRASQGSTSLLRKWWESTENSKWTLGHVFSPVTLGVYL